MMIHIKRPLKAALFQTMRGVRRRLLKQARLQDFDDEHPCLFVLSTGRVGTETIASLLSLAKIIFAYHEPTPKLYGLSKLAYEFSEEKAVHKVLKEAFFLSRKDLLDYSLDCEKGYVETSPQVTFLAPVILEAIPNVRFIHLARDPRSVVRSGMRRKWFEGNAADKTRITPSLNSDAAERWKLFTPFQKNLWLWAETNRWILQFCSLLPPDRTLLLHSEDVFGGGSDVLTKLFNFVGTELPSRKKIAGVLVKKLNAQKSGDFPAASVWTNEMNRDLHSIAGVTARSLGYQLS